MTKMTFINTFFFFLILCFGYFVMVFGKPTFCLTRKVSNYCSVVILKRSGYRRTQEKLFQFWLCRDAYLSQHWGCIHADSNWFINKGSVWSLSKLNYFDICHQLCDKHLWLISGNVLQCSAGSPGSALEIVGCPRQF